MAERFLPSSVAVVSTFGLSIHCCQQSVRVSWFLGMKLQVPGRMFHSNSAEIQKQISPWSANLAQAWHYSFAQVSFRSLTLSCLDTYVAQSKPWSMKHIRRRLSSIGPPAVTYANCHRLLFLWDNYHHCYYPLTEMCFHILPTWFISANTQPRSISESSQSLFSGITRLHAHACLV